MGHTCPSTGTPARAGIERQLGSCPRPVPSPACEEGAVATKGRTRHKFPIEIGELSYREELGLPAGWLIAEITNAAAAKYGTLTGFYEVIVKRALPPGQGSGP